MAAERVTQGLVNKLVEMDFNIARREAKRRFEEVTDEDTTRIIDEQRNENTKKKTKYDLNIFDEWLKGEKNENRDMEQIPPEELDKLIASFMLAMRKGDGQEYEPESLQSKFNSIGRHIREKTNININGDDKFRHSREVLNAKKKSLKQQGLGNRKKKADPFSSDDITKLREENLLGSGSPQAILNAMWLMTTMHFGLRGCQEHTQMLWGDVDLKTQTNGTEYIEFNERATKTRNGENREVRKFPPKMFQSEDDPTMCPVTLYKEYRKRRPSDALAADSRFYLQPVRKIKTPVWFSNNPVGKNSLCTIAKKMASNAGIQGRITNHSGRRTAIKTLLHNGVAPTSVMQLTGHKRIESLNHYSEASDMEQKTMSSHISAFMSRPDSSSEGLAQNPNVRPAPAPMTIPGTVNLVAGTNPKTSAPRPLPDQTSAALPSALLDDFALDLISDAELGALMEEVEKNPLNLEIQTSNMNTNSANMGFLNNAIFNGPVTINVVQSK